MWFIFTTRANQPPNPPIITGPDKGKVRTTYDYNFTAIDPDGDKLKFKWYVYPEAGTYKEKIYIIDDTDSIARVIIPKDASGKQIHIVLEVADTNRIASLFDYRRIVINVGN